MTPQEHQYLNSLVAVKVMGHELSKKFPGLMIIYENDRLKHRVIPAYSTDIVEAFKVVEALKEMNCCIKFDLDTYGPVWSVTIKGGKNLGDCKVKAHVERSDVELPEVICLAAVTSMNWVPTKKLTKKKARNQ